MVSNPYLKSVGIIWTTYHYYLGEIASLLADSQTRVTVYLYSKSSETPAPIQGVTFRFMSNTSFDALKEEIEKAHHKSVLICGWHIKLFRFLARNLNSKVFLFIDNPWRRTLRQLAGSLFFRIFWLRNYDGVIVPGVPQKKFAHFLGFKEERIQVGFFSFLNKSLTTGLSNNPTREFIFIGRLVAWKGILELAHAYAKYRSLVCNPWPLIVCGDGVLRGEIDNIEGLELKGFLQKEELFAELKKRRVFISCGLGEHWGISIYEATFFGHPLILSSNAGAATTYLIHGINGISINGRDSEDILDALLHFHEMNDSELDLYSINSARIASGHDSEYFKTKVIPFIFDEE